MAVLPVTTMVSGFFPSRCRFSLAPSVGEKCRSATQPTNWRFISSGKGEYLSYVRRPASTWPTAVWL